MTSNQDKSDLSAKKQTAISLLIAGMNHTNVAKHLNITATTVSRWMNDDVFVSTLNKLKAENLNATRAKIQSVASKAVDTLSEIMESSNNDNARITAATKILEMAGLTQATSQLYGVGIGATSVEELESEKKTDELMKVLTESCYM